jgi:hypothetical protein
MHYEDLTKRIMKKILLLSLGFLMISGCGATKLQSFNQEYTLIQSESKQLITVGTAKTLKKLADREAKAWSPRAALKQLDGWNISYNGSNDHPTGAIWKFYYTTPENQAMALAVIFNSENEDIVVQEESINQVFSDIPVKDWNLDSPQVMKLANERGVTWFPVSRARLNYWKNTLVWQARSYEQYAAMDAMTGEPFQKPDGKNRLPLN